MKKITLLFFLFYSSIAYPQDSLNIDLDMLIEDASSQSNSDADIDWSNITDVLIDLAKNPIDLNHAKRHELQTIPFLTPILINNLYNHIRKNGPLLSIYELQAVPGFDRNVFDKIKPYITVTGKSLDLSNNNLHPKGPTLSEIWKDGKLEIIQRFSRELQNEKGYVLSDTIANRYLGNPWRTYTRIRYRYNPNVSISLLGEKDPGEQFLWNPQKKYYGYDFLSGHVAIKNFGNLKSLVIGDFNLQYGQGLVFSRGLGFGKSGEVINTVKPMYTGILPYSSVNESFFMRGTAVQYAINRLYFTAFGARTPQDASIIASLDTLIIEGNVIPLQTAEGIITSGLHRTPSELSKRNTLFEYATGGRLHYTSRNMNLGINGLYQHFSIQLQKSNPASYQFYNFQGKTNHLVSFDWDIVHRNFNIFGEVARSASGGIAATSGLLISLDPKVDLALNFRHFHNNFHSLKGYSFSERPYALQGETGFYTGIKITPHSKWQIASYIDHYQFAWYRYLVNYPSQGWEWLTQINYKPNRNTLFYLRYRIDQGQKNIATYEVPTENLRFLIARRKQNLRLDCSAKLHRTLAIHSRAEHSWFWLEYKPKQLGFLIFQDLVWTLNYKFKFTGRMALFDINSYDARIYAYENNLPTVFSIPAYNGRGIRSYAILQFTPIKSIDIWLRYALFNYDRLRTIGSGLAEIHDTKNSELSIQLRLKL